RVDHGVEPPSGERREVARAIALHVLGVREEAWVRAAAVEERHRVTARKSGLDDRPTDELRTTEDEQLHAGTPSRSSSSSLVSTSCADSAGVRPSVWSVRSASVGSSYGSDTPVNSWISPACAFAYRPFGS